MEDSFEALRFALVDVDLDFSRNRFVVLDVRLRSLMMFVNFVPYRTHGRKIALNFTSFFSSSRKIYYILCPLVRAVFPTQILVFKMFYCRRHRKADNASYEINGLRKIVWVSYPGT